MYEIYTCLQFSLYTASIQPYFLFGFVFFFLLCLISSSVPNGDFPLKSGYKVPIYIWGCVLKAYLYKNYAFSTCVTHMNLKCEPCVLSPAVVQLYYSLFFS